MNATCISHFGSFTERGLSVLKTMSNLPKTLFLPLLGAALLLSPALRGCAVPFLAALVIARWADRPVSRLAGWMPRPLAALVILSITALLVVDTALLLGVQLWRALPMASGLLPGADLFAGLEELSRRLPGPIGSGAAWVVQQLRDQSGLLHTRLEAKAADLTAGFASALPRTLLTAGITLLAAFYACADWERVSRWVSALVPEQWRSGLSSAWERLGRGAAGWLRVQGRLLLVQWAILWAGLGLLRVPGNWAAALAIALADALPLLGSGVLLLPWAGLSLAAGQGSLALGLALLWSAAALNRSLLEPKLLGQQAGSSPLLTLLVLYAGLRLWGVAGMVAGPIALHALMGQKESKA